jgi:hypothetical protein
MRLIPIEAPRPTRPAAGPPRGAQRSTGAAAILALQRTAGNAAVSRALRAREGKALNPDADVLDQLDGRRRLLQRLTIKQYAMTKGTCGERNVQWVFSLDKEAPEDGYIVQHVVQSESVATCPDRAKGAPKVAAEYWEAWFVKKGDKLDWTTVRDKWTDSSARPQLNNQNGTQISSGEVKFFKKSTTGDLGDFGTAPADPHSDWGPGKVPSAGALPSTAKKPSWWDTTPVEGPASRRATSKWDCCDADASKHTNDVTAEPKP